jgi:toxin ParE1/3/4
VTRRVNLSIEAFAQVAEAFLWYQGQRPNLGWEFDSDLTAVFEMLRQLPEAAPQVHRGLRRALLRKFPYAVYYQLQPEEIRVRAVLHMRRRPRRWRRAG